MNNPNGKTSWFGAIVMILGPVVLALGLIGTLELSESQAPPTTISGPSLEDIQKDNHLVWPRNPADKYKGQEIDWIMEPPTIWYKFGDVFVSGESPEIDPLLSGRFRVQGKIWFISGDNIHIEDAQITRVKEGT